MRTFYRGALWVFIPVLLLVGGVYALIKGGEKVGFEVVPYVAAGGLAIAMGLLVVAFIGEGMSEWEERYNTPIIKND